MNNSERNTKEQIINNIKKINTLVNNSGTRNEIDIKINIYKNNQFIY